MSTMSITNHLLGTLRTPVGFLIAKGRAGTKEEIRSWEKTEKPNHIKRTELFNFIGVSLVVASVASFIIARVKESKLVKLTGKLLALLGIGTFAIGILDSSNVSASKQTKKNEIHENPISPASTTCTGLAVIPKGQSSTHTTEDTADTSKPFWKRIPFNHYRTKIIQSIRSNTFAFLDDPEIDAVVNGVLGASGILILDLLRALRHNAQFIGTATPNQEQENLRRYYLALGLEEGASFEDIKAAYRRLARQYHPDVNLGSKEAEQIMKELNEAYDTLEKLAQSKKNT